MFAADRKSGKAFLSTGTNLVKLFFCARNKLERFTVKDVASKADLNHTANF
jgi:hypothetical protein